MSAADEKLAQLRAARDAARADLLGRTTRIRNLSKPGELRRRLTNDVKVQGRKALSQAMEIASDERGILAGTLTALALWLARKQILAKAVELAPKAKPALREAQEWAREAKTWVGKAREWSKTGLTKARSRLPHGK